MMWQEAIALARAAIESGDLAAAQDYKQRAQMLKELDKMSARHGENEYEYEDEKMYADEMKAMREELESLKSFRSQMENEPAMKSAGHLVVTADETDKMADAPFKSLGEQLFAVAEACMRPNRADPRLMAQVKRAKALGLSEGVPSDGGWLVQPEFTAEILSRMNEMGTVMNRTRRIQIGANSNALVMNSIDETSRATGSRWGGIQGYWLAEAGTKLATKPKFRQMTLQLKKLAGVAYATDELLADTTALGNIMTQGFSEELMFLIEDSIINGTGAGQPLGILQSPALVTVAKETGQAANTLVTNNIFKMWSRMWSRSRANAVWYINQDIEPQLLALDMPVGTGGMPVYLPANGISGAPFGTLLGRPIVPIEYSATLGTVGDVILADLSQYIMIEKGGLQAETSIHVQFLTDETAYRFVYRVDGQPAWHDTLTPFKGSATQSPFVALATRA
jgi:HK97 family phage major capsid protein